MHVLAVEDDNIPLRVLERNIKKCGYTVSLAHSGMEAWKVLNTVPVDMVVTDWIMPEMNGLELCRRIRNTDFKHYIYIIIVTAQEGKDEIIQGLEAGADDYLIKPVHYQELQARIKIGARIAELEKELTERYNVIQNNFFQTIQMFNNLIELFNADLGGHSRRVAQLSLRLGERLHDVLKEELPILETAGLLHDVGMIGLPVNIMSKKRTEMNQDERKLYLSHPVQGATLLNEIEFLQPVAALVKAHHEQFNGRGFPDGLEDKEIPLLVKIVSSASIYDNLIYKGKVPLEEIPEHLQRLKGYQLDPMIVDQLLEVNFESIKNEKGKNFLEIILNNLEEGMILAENVLRSNGVLVMPGDMKLTSSGIEKLKNFHNLGCIPNKVYIYK